MRRHLLFWWPTYFVIAVGMGWLTAWMAPAQTITNNGTIVSGPGLLQVQAYVDGKPQLLTLDPQYFAVQGNRLVFIAPMITTAPPTAAVPPGAATFAAGQRGLLGLPGRDGRNGANGRDGARGPQGLVGPAGPRGPVGATGPPCPPQPPAKAIQ